MNATSSFLDTDACYSMWLHLISNMQLDLQKAHSQIADLQIGITMHHDLLTDCYFRLYTKECEMTVQAKEFETIMYRESMKIMQRSTFHALSSMQFHAEYAMNECRHNDVRQ